MIDRATIDKIMDAANIVDVVSDFVTLKRAGANLKGLCPFHDDRTPSFMVSPAKNYCKCFACGKGGNPVGFIMEHEQISYPEALRYLARKYGIAIEEKEMSQEDLQRQDDRESMFIVNEWANQWFQHQLHDTPDGRAIGLTYFRQRGFRDDIIQKFQLGFCPDQNVEVNTTDKDGTTRLLRFGVMSNDALKAGYQEKYLTNDPETGLGTGISIKNDRGALRDRYWGRVIFPIHTMSGKVVGFGGRVLDAATKGVNVKYQNSPESIIYSKKRELYGLFQAKQAIRKHDLCFLVEGYTDVMAMHQSGVENVVASSGTALTDDQIRLIHRLTDNITVIYDGDAAGIKASQRGIDMLLAQGMNVRLLLLPDGDDPDSFARKHNAEEFQQYLGEHQVDFIKFKTDLLLEEAKGDPMAKSKLVNNIVQSISVIPNEITRAIYVQATAATMQMQEGLITSAVARQVEQNLEEARKQRERERDRRNLNQIASGSTPPPPSANEEVAEVLLPTSDIPLPPSDLPQSANATGAPSSAETAPYAPLVTGIRNREERRFHDKEEELVRLILRHGEQMVGTMHNDNGEEQPITIIEYIAASLIQDELQLSVPLHKTIVELALQHVHDAGFVAEKFFLNYPDPTINSFTFDMVTDKEQLSRMHQKKQSNYSEPEVNLTELTNHLLTDYKIEIVNKELKQIMREMQDPELIKDKDRFTTVMTRYKEFKDIEKKLAHQQGGRVMK
ncbi:MAG: DNA primase [Bacteroidaceae bacterium]|nr:DNA primase [Bacteroidaceae bacterium]